MAREHPCTIKPELYLFQEAMESLTPAAVEVAAGSVVAQAQGMAIVVAQEW